MFSGLWDRVRDKRWVHSWVVVLAALGALAITLSTPVWPSAESIVVLSLAAMAASALMVPMPGGDHHTLVPAAVAAGLVLFEVPAVVLAMAAGVIVGHGILRRRSVQVTLFTAGQVMLATLAARALAHLVSPTQTSWIQPIGSGRPDLYFALAVASAATAFVLVFGTLTALRVAVERRGSFVDVFLASLILELVNTSVLFVLGTIVALVVTRILPLSALLIMIPVAMVSVTVLGYAGRRQLTEEVEVLHGVAMEMSRNLTVDEIAQTIANGAERLVPADITLIYLRAPGKAMPRVAHYRGPDVVEAGRELEPDGIIGHVLRSGRPVRVADYTRDPRRSLRAESIFSRGTVQSVLVVPITSGWEIWGALVLATGVRNYFTDRHERLLTTLAGQTAPAIRSAHLFDETQRQVERLAALQHLGLHAGGTLDPDEAYRHLVVQAAETLGARHAFLSLYDERTRELYGQVAHGTDDADFTRMRARADAEATALHEAVKAFRERRPVVCQDLVNAPSRCPALQRLSEARSALTAPLIRLGRPIGAITVVRTEARPFTETEIATLEAIAAQGAVGIENARLHASTTVQLRQLETMVNIARRLSASQNLREIFHVITETAHDVMRIQRCALMIWDAQGNVGDSFFSGISQEFVQVLRQQFQAGVGRHLVQGTSPLIVGDLGQDSRMNVVREAARAEGLKACVFVPLRWHGEVLGVLALLNDGPFDFPAEQLRQAEALAGQAAVAAKYAILVAQSERRRDEVILLNRIVASASASLDLGEIFRAAVAELASATGAPRVAIYRVEGSWLHLAAQVGTSELPSHLSVTAGLLGRVVRTGRAEYLTNMRDDPDDISRTFDAVTRCAVPILSDGTATGVLLVDGTASDPVTPQMFELLMALSQQLGVAVRNASLYEELQKAHDELQVLYEAARSVSGTLDLHTLLDSLVSVTCRAFGYDNGALMLVDQETGDLTIAAAYGLADSITGVRLAPGGGITGWVARTGTPLVVDDVLQDSRYYRVDDRTRSELAVPLIAEGKVLGVLNVESARQAAFGQRDVRLLTTLASYAVIAIQNAHLYEQAQRLAITDGLTELYNHRYLYEALERLVERARRDGQPLSLIMLEIDNFKRFNDTYGHQSGDEVLRTVATLLRRGSRPSDVVARYGGDEFMIVLPGVGKSAAQETAERLRRAVEAYPHILSDEVIATVTLSVGVATFPTDGRDVDMLVEAVDRAQYIAKRSGGNKVHVLHDV